ncbi:MAG: flavoprotein [Nocardioides sp.]
MPRLTLVVCGAPLAARADDVAGVFREGGWEVAVLPTEAAAAWTGGGGRHSRLPSDPTPGRPDAVVVCPMTFNTANKWANGIADSRVLSLLCEVLGLGSPVVAVPFVNEALWRHQAWSNSLGHLRAAGVHLVDPRPDLVEPVPLVSGSGERVAAEFDPRRILVVVRHLFDTGSATGSIA